MQNILKQISVYGRLLGAIFYYDPSDSRLDKILSFFSQDKWLDDWEMQHNAEIREQITGLINQGLNQNLTEQYQRLFIGPNNLPAPPWGSVYLDPESVIFGQSLLALRDFLRQHQIEFQTQQDEPEDHIGLMLMFSAYIAENQPHLIVEFLRAHLLTWATHFLQQLAQVEDASFYQGIAILTKQILRHWQINLHIDVPQVKFYR